MADVRETPRTIANWLARVTVGLVAAVVVGIPLLFLTGFMPHDSRAGAGLVVLGVAVLAGARALCIRVVLKPDGVVVTNYFRREDIAAADVDAVVPSYVRIPNPTQGRMGCAGLRLRGSRRLVPLLATMSWGWRFGQPSGQAKRIAETLTRWGEGAGVVVQVTAEDLVRATRGVR